MREIDTFWCEIPSMRPYYSGPPYIDEDGDKRPTLYEKHLAYLASKDERKEAMLFWYGRVYSDRVFKRTHGVAR